MTMEMLILKVYKANIKAQMERKNVNKRRTYYLHNFWNQYS